MPWYEGTLDQEEIDKRKQFISDMFYAEGRLSQGALGQLDYNIEMLPSQVVTAMKELKDLIRDFLSDIQREETRRLEDTDLY